MDRFELQRLRDIPIEGVAERLGLRVTRHKCLCPFHDDHHASLSFSTRRNTFRCFACGASGNNIDLAMRILGADFREACRWLADGCSLSTLSSPRPPSSQSSQSSQSFSFDATRYERYFERPFLNAEARRFLYDERRLDERVVRWCRLTSWRDRMGTPWLQIPYYDAAGRLTGVQNRNLLKGAQPRFRFPRGSHCGIYNIPVLSRLAHAEPLYIAEGSSDCWAMLSAGHKAIAIPSATILRPRDIEALIDVHRERATTFHMYPDADAPGEALYLHLRDLLPNLQRHQLPPGCKDYSEYYLKK